MLWWGWVIFGISLFIAELFVSSGFYLLFFALGALIVGGLLGIGLEFESWLQWLTFSFSSLGMIFFLRAKVYALVIPEDVPDKDKIEGERAKALTEILIGQEGKVEARGSIWSCVNTGLCKIESGDQCKILEKEGLRLKVIKE